MPTVWMGVFSPIKDMSVTDENSVGGQAADLTGIAARMMQKRGPPKSSVTTAPRRVPLRHSLRPPQETTISEDIPGRMTGKENLPPGHEIAGDKKKGKKKALGESSQQPHYVPKRPAIDLFKKQEPSCCDPKTLSMKVSGTTLPAQNTGFHRPQTQINMPVFHHQIDSGFARLSITGKDQGIAPVPSSSAVLPTSGGPLASDRKEKLQAKTTISKLAGSSVHQKYPLLSEDIQNPSLYENNWLSHQEIAITQLVNNLLTTPMASDRIGDLYMTRSRLLNMYQDQSFVIMQSRLQASLLYGSLTVPKEILAKSTRLSEDLAMKSGFLNFWLNTYHLPILQSCAEVVIGRECSISPGMTSTAQAKPCSTPTKATRQTLSRYLETFFICNADTFSEHQGSSDAGATGLHQTLLRSLMLIQLLDKAKTTSQTPLVGCLFQASSPYKSSTAVLQALAQMLHPAAGNIVRSLSHLNYHVSHVQYPLEEYEYQIHNLAVDLRDGVKLTRLVEKLLCGPSSRLHTTTTDTDNTTTVTMPSGETLSMMQGEQDWPLSQHLKFPCLGRATKVYNVQIALSALSGVNGIGKIVEDLDIKAEDIVDGFREKTVALLWGLVSKWGLGSLIDWVDVRREIQRLGGTVSDDSEEEYGNPGDDLATHKILLKEWASAAAAHQGLSAHNLTTSFADGRVYEAIVDQYETFLEQSNVSTFGLATKANRQLSYRLTNIGCSSQFGKHI